MKTRPSDDPNDHNTRIPMRRLRVGLYIFVILAFAIPCVYFGPMIYRSYRHRIVYDRLETSVLRLSFHRPEGVSEDQWAGCINWTINLIGNSAAVETMIPTKDLDRIQREFDSMIDAGPDIATIDWLWDEFGRYSKTDYQQYRPTLPHWWEAHSEPVGGQNRIIELQTLHKDRIPE